MSINQHSSALALRRLIVGYRLSQSIYVAAKLGIADLLKDGPKSVDDLAEATGAQAASLYRVLRLLASEGVFAELAQNHFELTPLAVGLQIDAANSFRARAIFDAEECNWGAWGNLLHSVTTGESAFEYTFEEGEIFDYLKQNPAAASSFDNLMVEQTTSWSPAIVDAYDFSGVRKVADIGGGYGALLATILAAHPAMQGILFDLPHVIAGSSPTLEAAGVMERCQVVSGDFFETAPKSGERYILKHILHDWDEDRCWMILRNCRQVMPAHGRLLIIEILISSANETDYGKFLDVNMLVLLRGRERTEAEYRAQLAATGFALSRVISTQSELSILECLPI